MYECLILKPVTLFDMCYCIVTSVEVNIAKHDTDLEAKLSIGVYQHARNDLRCKEIRSCLSATYSYMDSLPMNVSIPVYH